MAEKKRALYEAILPSGRGIRFEKLTTGKMLDMSERVAFQIGDAPDPGGARAKKQMTVETIAGCVKQVTAHSVAWIFVKDDKGAATDVVDVDATLESAKNQWLPVTYEQLITKGGEYSIFELFEDIGDFMAVDQFISMQSNLKGVGKTPFAGRVRTILAE